MCPQAMNFAPQKSSEYPSCTKTVTIRMNGHTIKLKQGREVLVDEQEVSQLPFTAAGAYIHIVSSIFLMGKVHLFFNALQVSFHVYLVLIMVQLIHTSA